MGKRDFLIMVFAAKGLPWVEALAELSCKSGYGCCGVAGEVTTAVAGFLLLNSLMKARVMSMLSAA